MEDWSGFRGTFGCLSVLFEIGLLFYAIMEIALGEATAHAWGILIGVVMSALVQILYHRATKRDYNRKDSYWSKKEETEDTSKTDK